MDENTLKSLYYYDGISRGYHNLYGQEQENKIDIIKDKLPDKGIILDAGAGDGILNKFLSKNLELYSVDLSEELLKLNDSHRKIQADLQKLPLKNSFADYVICLTAIQDTSDKEKVIQELKRVLKPEGKIIISHLNKSKQFELIEKTLESNFRIEEIRIEEKDKFFIGKK